VTQLCPDRDAVLAFTCYYGGLEEKAQEIFKEFWAELKSQADLGDEKLATENRPFNRAGTDLNNSEEALK
jgi:hypothetical protein